MKNSPTAGYRVVAKNLPVVVAKPNEAPLFYGPLLRQEVRNQLVQVLEASVGTGPYAERAWAEVASSYAYGMGTRIDRSGGIPYQVACLRFITQNSNHESLDVIGLALRLAEWYGHRLDVGDRGAWRITMPPDEAVSETNRFLREADVPYQFERGQWLFVPEDYIHEQVVSPALNALGRPGFEGALQEFDRALEHLHSGNAKEAATEACKALESTIKCICVTRGWTYPQNATAKPLFDVLVAHGFAETWMEGIFLGCPNIRNKGSAHGQGQTPQPMPGHRAQLAVNLAASVIVALLAAHDAGAPC